MVDRSVVRHPARALYPMVRGASSRLLPATWNVVWYLPPPGV